MTRGGGARTRCWRCLQNVFVLLLLRNSSVKALSIRIGTRPSPLALKQAQSIAAALQDANPSIDTELVLLDSQSEHKVGRDDATQSKPLAMTSTVDFTGVIDKAIMSGNVDMGVHSLKDIPADHKWCAGRLRIACFLPRACPLDVLIGAESLQTLPHGARVGSASTRRQSQLLSTRSDLHFVNLRGNVETRLKHLQNGLVDALVMARAGLDRLGISSQEGNMTLLSAEEMMPGPGQGIVGAVCCADNTRMLDILESIDNKDARIAAVTERAVLNTVDARLERPFTGRPPLAAFMEPLGDCWLLRVLLLRPDGQKVLRAERQVPQNCSEEDARKIGDDAGEELLQRAGNKFFEEWKMP